MGDGIIKKKDEEMKWFKLELQNRENNFNKVFGSQPNVGVLNPNTTMAKKPGKENSRNSLQSGQGKASASSKNIAYQAALNKGAMIPTGNMGMNMGMLPPGPPKNNNTSFARK